MKDIDLDSLQYLPLVILLDGVLMPKLTIPIILTRHEYSALRYSKKGHIGVVQASGPNEDHNSALFQTGCLGRIIDIEMIKNQLVVEVEGICRFDINELKPAPFEENPILHVNYTRYLHDLNETSEESFQLTATENKNFSKIQERMSLGMFKKTDIDLNIWKKISNQKMIAALSALSPLQSIEKQAILEKETINEQSQLMIEFMLDHSIVNHFYNDNNPITYH